MFGLLKPKEDRKAKAAHISKEFKEKEAKYEKEYRRICAEVNSALLSANKPQHCNIVTSHILGADCVSELESDQWSFQDWEIWRNADKLYLYREEVLNYPNPAEFGLYAGQPAPMLIVIPLIDIQYFKTEGGIATETKVIGGEIKQNRSTGRIHQTPIKIDTKNKDIRYTRMTLQQSGIVRYMDFTKDAYDILFALIPEKECSQVVQK